MAGGQVDAFVKDLEEVIRRIPTEPVGTHLLASRGACWQKYAPGMWRRTEVGDAPYQYDDVANDRTMVMRLQSVLDNPEFEVNWTLY